uniref:Uncharacterized protein n=1 Tax=Meleagris gallopavo TaxID=9103 RepID=A0A803YG35_MELGA
KTFAVSCTLCVCSISTIFCLCLTTEYVEKYPKYSNISPARSLKPKQEYQAHRGKMEGITTFK